jgi:hypothetical protein
MFDMIKPQLIALLASAANTMVQKSLELHHTAQYAEAGGQKDLAQNCFIRAAFWADAADMIRKSIAQ